MVDAIAAYAKVLLRNVDATISPRSIAMELRMLSREQLCWHVLNLDLNYEATIASAILHLESLADVGRPALVSPPGTGLGTTLVDAARQHLHIVPPTRVGPVEQGMIGYLLTQFAPQALLAGCTLQNFTHAANCHQSVPALVHRVHSWQVGGGRINHNHANQYRRLLAAAGVQLPGVASPRFYSLSDFAPTAWALPAYRLSLSLFPDSRRGEIMGAALFEIVAGLDQMALPEEFGALLDTSGYLLVCSGKGRDDAIANLLLALDQELAQRPESQAAIERGFLTSLSLHVELLSALRRHLDAGAIRPHEDMVRLVERKARYAVGYHAKLKLNGTPFETLLMSDADAFVRALGVSRWITPGNPAASLLLNKLSSFGGPMYRVFNDDETAVISNWISSLANAETARPMGAENATVTAKVPAEEINHMAPPRIESLDARTLYHRLLNNEHCPRLRASALDYVDTWFGRAALNVSGRRDAAPFQNYSHARLRGWFEKAALSQAGAYVADAPVSDKSRDDVIDEALQLCPMILIDGAWLQKWGNAGLAESPVGAILYKIFSDEIGNGNVVENHPNIYRALMDEMRTGLPDFRSAEFAYSEKFEDDAFAVPAFWLSLSQFPSRFIPETLGINLAMELSGVGGAYRNARNELKHHGFSTLFVELHNTIDNVSSGHSAMAIDAIEHYMDDVLALHDQRLTREHWQRVWIGYGSLSKPDKRWNELFRKPRYLKISQA